MLRYIKFGASYFPVLQLKSRLPRAALKETPTHELLQLLGFIKQTRSGLVHWLPLGLRSLNKVQNIVRHRMNEDGHAIELELSALSPKSLWTTTGRWSNKELFKLKDSKNVEYCLTATCEEDVTQLVKEFATTQKDLPLLVYQITRKYRDELRPRGGLLRGREFWMKDAYSFAHSKDKALQIFNKMNDVYSKIFHDLQVPFVAAWADSGSIGGDLSKEYHYVHPSGEDFLLECDNCKEVFNVEKCESYPQERVKESLGVSVRYALTKDHCTLVCFYYPSNRQLNWTLAQKAMDHDIDENLKDMSNDNIIEIFQKENEDMMLSKILRVMDARINSRSNFPDFPLRQYSKNNFGQIVDISLVDAVEGEVCGSCNDGTLHGMNSIEVGHTFHLGAKYTVPMKATYSNKEQIQTPIEMGCYGIGVSRLIGAIAEITRDDRGIRWPSSIAPYTVSICSIPGGKFQENVNQLLERMAQSSIKEEVLCFAPEDKRGIGSKIEISHAIGIPLCIIVGPKSWPSVEIEVRAKRKSEAQHEENSGLFEKHIVPVDNVVEVVEKLLQEL